MSDPRWYYSLGDEGRAVGPFDTEVDAERELRDELVEQGVLEGELFQARIPSWSDYVTADELRDWLERLTDDDRHEESRLADIPGPILEHAAGALRRALAGWAPDWLQNCGAWRKVTLAAEGVTP